MQSTEAGKAVADVLNVLADKLGSTGEYLWQTMVQGAFVSGIALLAYSLFGMAVMVGAWAIIRSGVKKDSDDRVFGGGLLMALGLVLVGLFTYQAAMGIGAPEYVALREVLSAFK